MGRNNKKGCIFAVLGCTGLAVIVATVAGFYIYNQAKEIGETVKNPEPKTLEMLGIETMPEGYHAHFAVRIPFLVDIAMMSKEPVTYTDEGHLQRHSSGKEGFMYFKFIKFKEESGNLQGYFEGTHDNDRVLSENGVNINTDEILERGAFTLKGNEVFFLTQRGTVNTDVGARAEGLITLLLIPCPTDNKMRMGIWYGPENESTTDNAEASSSQTDSLEGTVGDLNRVKAFMNQFKFCTQ